jgi:hypothetical protein
MNTSQKLLSLVIGVGLVASQLGCATNCYQDATGTHCTAKSLKRFDGPPPAVQVFDRAPGAPVTVDVLYGNVTVQRSTSGKIEVQFLPFAYQGYDEQALATREMTQNLRTSAVASNGVVATVSRQGGSNGVGAGVVVRLPDDFDGALNIVNRGGGPLNEFNVQVDFVGRASAVNINNQSILGSCSLRGAPTVRTTTVDCGDEVAVWDVTDAVTISSRDTSHDGPNPAIQVRLAALPAGSRGGSITSASGAVSVTLPAAGGYVVAAQSPVKGAVQEGALPAGCAKQEASAQNKTITCGQGPTFQVTAGANPGPLGRDRPSDVVLAYQ